MRGAELVVQALARQGVSTIFSLSGNQIMPIYDACIDAKIRIVHVRHEAAAVFMADAWSQVTGEIGVALLTAGPGIANGVAPLFSARHAESPVLLLLSGDSPLAEDGTGAFQELDQTAMTRPLTKLSARVGAIDALVPAVDHAIALALAPRQGPVHLALPFDLLTASAATAALPPLPASTNPRAVDPAVRAAIASLLAAARRPLILCGPAACRHHRLAGFRQAAHALQVPLVAMESPRGLRDPSLGAIAASMAEADLVVLAGKPLDFTLGFGRSAFAADAAFVVIDPDPEVLDRAERLLGPRLRVRCQADALQALGALAVAPASPRADWRARVQRDLADRSLPAATASGAIASPALCQAVQRQLDIREVQREVILVCDGGEFGQWAQAFCSAPIRIVNGTAGAIGGGTCYAIAAKIARPEAHVVLLMGDGTAGFHFTEFDTAVREGAAFTAVIGNDLRWNAEHVIQLRSYGEARLIGCGLSASARYHLAAEAFGGFGVAVDRMEDLDAALHAAFDSGLPACVNVQIDGQPAPTFSGPAAAASH